MLVNKLKAMNLQLFAADNGGGTGGSEGVEGGQATGEGVNNVEGEGAKGKESKGNENMIPKTRFDEVNNKYKELKSQLDELLSKKENEEIEGKKKAGEFEELYNKVNSELDKFKNESKQGKERVETLEGVINNMLETKLQAVPEEFRDLIPSGMAPEAKLAWLAQAEAKGLFGSVNKSEQPVGGSTNPSGKQNSDLSKLSPMELLKAAYSKVK